MSGKDGAAVDSIWEHREVRFDILLAYVDRVVSKRQSPSHLLSYQADEDAARGGPD